MSVDDLADLDATAQAELVRRGDASPVELVEAAIERAEAVNPALNAIIRPLYEQAREAAAGEVPDGPFRGVPFLLKDLGAGIAGESMHLGISLLKEIDFRSPVDSYLAERFRAAGLIHIGRTNTPELGILPTAEPRAYGATHNPWDLGRSSGGSSGGSAAAVAAGIVPIAHANDGGGSIRIPASACGLFGLKPTRARISEGPLVGDVMSGLTVEGVVSRSVRDTAAALDAIQGPAPGDPYVAPAPARPYLEEVGVDPGRLRVGLRLDPLDEELELDPIVVEAAREAGSLLEGLGHEVDLDSPEVPRAPGVDPIESFMTRWHAGQAATLDQLATVLGREIEPGDVEPLTWAMAEEGRRRNASQYLNAVGLHQALTRLLEDWFERGHDLLLTPTLGEPPPPLGSFDDSGDDPLRAIRRARLTANFTALFNATGNPAISVPLHTSQHQTGGADGAPAHLPIGVQMVAPYGREDLLIRLAAQLEQARPWAERHPPVWAGAASAESA
jgi:amidase